MGVVNDRPEIRSDEHSLDKWRPRIRIQLRCKMLEHLFGPTETEFMSNLCRNSVETMSKQCRICRSYVELMPNVCRPRRHFFAPCIHAVHKFTMTLVEHAKRHTLGVNSSSARRGATRNATPVAPRPQTFVSFQKKTCVVVCLGGGFEERLVPRNPGVD